MSVLELLQDLRKADTGRPSPHDVDRLLAHLESLRHVIRRIANGVVADEGAILNDAAYKICTHIESFRGATEGEAFNFCSTVVHNTTIEFFRRARGRWNYVDSGRSGSLQADADESADDIATFPDERSSSNPEEEASSRQALRLLHSALDALESGERDAVWELVVEDGRVVDMARKTGERQNTISQRKKRALQKLAAVLPRDLAEAYVDRRRPARAARKRRA